MKKEEIILTDDEKNQLNELAEEYFEVCAEYKSIDAKKKALGSIIKTTMETFGVSKYVSNENISLSVSRRKNISFDEDLLLSECRNFNIDNLIKTKELLLQGHEIFYIRLIRYLQMVCKMTYNYYNLLQQEI